MLLYTECCYMLNIVVSDIVMLNVVMLNVAMLNVVMLKVTECCFKAMLRNITLGLSVTI
jgi:hypothetical protein